MTASEGSPSGAGRAPSEHRHHHDHRGMHEEAWTRERAEAVLDAPERRQTQDPFALWRRAGLFAGAVVVDVGAGSGYFAFPAAELVGRGGRVYAVDVSAELVDLLRERSRQRDAANVLPLRSTPDHIPLGDRLADFVLLANVLHGVPPSTLVEVRRILKPDGRLVNVDWKKEPTPGGPPAEARLTPQEAEAALVRHGFAALDGWDLGPYHYAQIFRPAAGDA